MTRRHLRTRLASLFRRQRMETELDAELKYHIDMLVEQNVAAGMAPDEAKRAALYAKAQEMMNMEVPSVISAFFDLLAAQRAYVEGYTLHPRGSVFRLDLVSLGAGAPKRG